MPDIELHECTTLAEAAVLMTRYGSQARILAGGTDLLVDLKAGRVRAPHVVSIHRVNGLRGVAESRQGLHIGALTTIRELDESPLLGEPYAAIRDATREMASPQIRGMATVGGNLASAVPCADLPPVLMVLDASVVLWSPSGERRLPLRNFFVSVRRTATRSDELLTAVLVPAPPPGFGAAYARFALREGNGIAVAAVAASLRLADNGAIEDAHVVLGAVAPIPKPAEAAGDLLRGRQPGEDVFAAAAEPAMEAAEPISDVRGTASYRRELVGVLTRRALSAALGRARGVAPRERTTL